MGKYEIIKNGTDDYTLKYKDKEIKFHSNVELVTKMQMVNELANQKMVLKLAKEDMTPNDLIKKQIIDGKTYYDNSGKDAFLKSCITEVATQLFDEAIKSMFKMSFLELIKDIEITEKEESDEFAKELGEIIVGRFQGKGQN